MASNLEQDLFLIDETLIREGASFEDGENLPFKNVSQVSPSTTVGRINLAIEESTVLTKDIVDFFSIGGVLLFNSNVYGLDPNAGTGDYLSPGSLFPNGTSATHPTIVLNVDPAFLGDNITTSVTNPFSGLGNELSSATLYEGSGVIIGVLSHELGHFENRNGGLVGQNGQSLGIPADASAGNISGSLGKFVGTQLIDEGRAIYNDFVVAKQLAMFTGGSTQITDLPLTPVQETVALSDSATVDQENFAGDTALQIASSLSGSQNTYLYNDLTIYGMNDALASYFSNNATSVTVLTSGNPTQANYVQGVEIYGNFDTIEQYIAEAALTSFNIISFAQSITDSIGISGSVNVPLIFNSTSGSSQEIYTYPKLSDGNPQIVDEINSYTGSNGTGSLTETDKEENTTSIITTYSNDLATTTNYSSINGGGTGTVTGYDDVLPTVIINNNGSSETATTPTSFASIGSAIGFSTLTDAATLAVMNGAVSASELEQAPEAYVPEAVGGTVALTELGGTSSTSGMGSLAVTVQTNSWSFGGGILVLDAAGGASFTGLTMEGTDDPSNGTVYVMNTAGQLIDTLSEAAGESVSMSVTTSQDSVQTVFSITPSSQGNAATYSATSSTGQGGGSATAAVFTPADTNYGMPFFDASTASSSAGADLKMVVVDGYEGQLATFDTADETPDGNWSIGVNASGDAVFSGNAATGFTDTVALTPQITLVELGQSLYGLAIIPDAGLSGSVGSGAIVAEGTGTSRVNLGYDDDDYWHVNGSSDTIDLAYGTDNEFYFSGAESAYAIAYNGAGTLTVTGGSTGTTTFEIANGTGEINFADGSSIGLGGNLTSGIDDARMYGGSYYGSRVDKDIQIGYWHS
jgi:hypothetical protein